MRRSNFLPPTRRGFSMYRLMRYASFMGMLAHLLPVVAVSRGEIVNGRTEQVVKYPSSKTRPDRCCAPKTCVDSVDGSWHFKNKYPTKCEFFRCTQNHDAGEHARSQRRYRRGDTIQVLCVLSTRQKSSRSPHQVPPHVRPVPPHDRATPQTRPIPVGTRGYRQ